MKTPLRFLKKAALAAALPALVSTAAATSTSQTQPRLTWFSEAASAYAAPTAGAWSGDTAELDNGVLQISGDTVYTPTYNSTTNAAIKLTLKFSTFPTELPSTDMDGAQAAITAYDNDGVTNYYVYGKVNSSDASATWLPVSGVEAPEVDTLIDVLIDIDYETGMATYVIGNPSVVAATCYIANVPANKYVRSLSFSGDGAISGTLLGTKGTATHCIGAANYGSYADALVAAMQNGGTIQSWSGDAANGWTSVGTAGTGVGNGTAGNPYEIPDLAALKAFQAAVANSNGLTYCYVQTADITLDADWPGIGLQNGKDDYDKAAFDDAAFKGTYDGGNHTISNFRMVGGNLDYCGFFNSVSNATIQNLTIQYAGDKFAADSSSSTEESGATFVGVSKGATLYNLTALPKDANTGVSAGKGIGGIVGYLTCGSTVDSCTNRVTLTSHTNKAGGIAMIRQNGDSSTICNCLNTGMVSTSSSGSGKRLQFGGIVGYVDNALVISNCENTAACKVLHNNTGTITMQGENKGNATVASYTYASGHPVDGLNFATVDGNVATFVADNALVLNGSYKVMATGATATFAFAEPGTIAFDTALFTPTYAVTAAAGLDLTDATSGTVKTYTATVRPVRAVFLR